MVAFIPSTMSDSLVRGSKILFLVIKSDRIKPPLKQIFFSNFFS